ncbi:MAG: Uma2 family endonuclease [Gemmatimonadaceae bacterium]
MATRTLVTEDELFHMPDDGKRYELVRGVLTVGEPPGAQHGSIAMRLGILLGHHALANRLGVVFAAETGFVLARDPDTVRAPDIAFVRKDRIPPGGPGPKYFDGAPDLAVEVLSPDDTVYEVEEKVEECLAAGVAAVWVINPKRRRVTVYESDVTHRVLHEGDALEGGDILPGFRCAVREIFDWPL